MNTLPLLATAVIFGFSWAWAEAQEQPPANPPAAAGQPQADVLQHVLMNNGRLLVGAVTPHKDGGWNVRQKLGTIRVETDDVEGIFPSLQAVYEHKRELLPPRDIQERMRLYQWCMTQGLLADAREQLQAILALSPDHDEAKALLGLLETRIARNSVRTDNSVMRTSATRPSQGQPQDLDPIFVNRAMREMVGKSTPVIFDLPEALALKRAQEFNEFIHPTLQRFCASCHNERTPNGFGLVSAQGRAARDMTIQRANLDATLKLVDPENLMQSPLLTNSLLPHQPNNQPIFPGPNNPYYRVIANWVSNLQHRGLGAAAKPVAGSLAPSGDTAVLPASGASASGGFGVEGRQAAAQDGQPAVPIEANPNVARKPARELMVDASEPLQPAAPGRMIPGSYNGPDTTVPKDAKYPVPLSAGGSPEDLLKRLQAEESARDAREEAFVKAQAEKGGPVSAAAKPAESDNAGTRKPIEKPAASGKSAKKPVKIDERLLENFLNNTRPGG